MPSSMDAWRDDGNVCAPSSATTMLATSPSSHQAMQRVPFSATPRGNALQRHQRRSAPACPCCMRGDGGTLEWRTMGEQAAGWRDALATIARWPGRPYRVMSQQAEGPATLRADGSLGSGRAGYGDGMTTCLVCVCVLAMPSSLAHGASAWRAPTSRKANVQR